MALLVPDLSSNRGAARRIDCANRERQIGLATHMFQVDFNAFPGYWMPASSNNPIGTTWPITLSQYLNHPDIFKAWVSHKGIPANYYWDQMVCPADPPPTNTGHWLSYVVNCGLYGNNSNPADGVFFNELATPPPPKITSDSLAGGKGESATLLGSENTLGIVTGNSAGWLQSTAADALQYTGFCWQPVIKPNLPEQINGDKSNPNPPLPGTKLADYARPASYHPGGVNAVFCDGHTQFISEVISYKVYQILMSTDPKSADFPPGSPAIGYTLKSGDY